MPRPETTRSFGALSLACCLIAAGCGGDHDLGGPVVSYSEPSSPGELRIGECSTGADLELIDDMEDKEGTSPSILLIGTGRSGSWFTFNDKAGADSTQVPNMDDPFHAAELEPPRGTSRYAAWTAGHGFPVWGAGIGFDLLSQSAYDASGYAGIAFWARRAEAVAPTLRADIIDRNTSPVETVCDKDYECDQGASCDPAGRSCHDNFGAVIELEEDWTYYEFRWSELSQAGWSGNVYPAIIQSELYGIRFQTEPDTEFEFWIDDVAFLCP